MQEDDVAAVVDKGIRAVARAEPIGVLALTALQAIVALSSVKVVVIAIARQPVVEVGACDVFDVGDGVAHRFVVVRAKAVRSVKVDLRLCPRKVNPDPFVGVSIEDCVIVLAAHERVCSRAARERVCSIATRERVCACAARERVCACAAL